MAEAGSKAEADAEAATATGAEASPAEDALVHISLRPWLFPRHPGNIHSPQRYAKEFVMCQWQCDGVSGLATLCAINCSEKC